jgi:hypothetical protein
MALFTAAPATLDDLRPIPDLDAARAVWPRGRRLDAVRTACLAFKARFASQERCSASAA